MSKHPHLKLLKEDARAVHEGGFETEAARIHAAAERSRKLYDVIKQQDRLIKSLMEERDELLAFKHHVEAAPF